MPTLRVWAHWTDAPPPLSCTSPLPSAPVPASLRQAQYPVLGSTWPTWPRIDCTPAWLPPSPTSPTVDNVVVWCELEQQDDINSANWGGSTWPGPLPPSGDQGYSAQASGFKITEVRLILAVMNNDFVFTIQDPTGAVVAVVKPSWSGSYSIPYNMVDGKGIWTITINRTATSSVAAPSLRQGGPAGNSVLEPYVSPYGTNEGILGMEFVGEEIICPTDADVKLTAEIEDPPGSGTFQDIAKYPCIPTNRPIRFTATVSPGTATILRYKWNFKDGSPITTVITGATSNVQFHSYTQPLPNNQAYAPTVQVILSPCDPIVGSISVLVCTVCPSITALTANPSSGNAPLTVNFQATVTNPNAIVPDALGNLYHWDFGDGNTAHTTTANTSHTYTTIGTFPATVTVNVPAGCSATLGKTNVTVTTPTTPTTSTTPTTPTPTTSTTSTTPTTPTTSTTPTTPTTPPTSSLACSISLALALLLLGLASIGLALAGTLGPAGAGLIGPSLALATAGLIVLGLWIIFCRDCPVIRFLQRFFGAMALLLLLLSAIFVLFGLVGASLGAASVAALFGVMVGILTLGAIILRCP